MRKAAVFLFGVLTLAGCATTDSRRVPGGASRNTNSERAIAGGQLEDADACRERALALWREDKHEQAGQLLRRAIALAPDEAALRLMLARVLLDDGRPADASVELSAIKTRWPQSAAPHVLLGYVHHRQGDPGAAEAAFRSALARVPTPQERIAAHLGLGAVLEKAGRQAAADAQYAAAVALAPQLRGVLVDIQKQSLFPQAVAVEGSGGFGRVSERRLRQMKKVLRKLEGGGAR